MNISYPDNLYKIVSPRIWGKVASAKSKRAREFWLGEAEHQIRNEVRRLGSGCLSAFSHRSSKPKVSTCRLYRDSSGFVSLSLKKLPRQSAVSPQESAPFPLPVLPSAVGDAKRVSVSEQSAPSPIGLGSLAISHKAVNPTPEKQPLLTDTKSPRGSRGLSAHGKRLIVGSCNLLEELYGKDRLSFHTATLPRASDAELAQVAMRNQEFFKRWRFYLSRLLKSKGLDSERVVIVLEFQKRGAVHFHSVFQSSHVKWGDAISREDLDRVWKLCVLSLFPFFNGRNFKPSCRTEPIRKSVGRYMSKYLSKDFGKELPEFLKRTSITWYSVGKKLTKFFKERIECKEVEIENLDFERLKEQAEKTGKVRKPKLVGVRGYGYRVFYGYCDSLFELEELIDSLFRVRSFIPSVAKREEDKENRKEEESDKKEKEKVISLSVRKKEQPYQCSLFNLGSYQSLPSRISS